MLSIAALLVTAAPAAAEDPRPQNPVGATVTITKPTVAVGGTVSFTGTGFVNTRGTGQVITVKLDDVDIIGQATASASGAVSGSVTLPATVTGDGHWLRFLSGAGQADDMPARSLFQRFTVTAAPATATPTPTAATTPATTTTSAGAVSTTTGSSGTTTGTTTLPQTGVEIAPWLIGAAGFAVLALALSLFARRRRFQGQ